MTVKVLNRWQQRCTSCEHVVTWETLQTDVPGTKAVTICRCEHCARQK